LLSAARPPAPPPTPRARPRPPAPPLRTSRRAPIPFRSLPADLAAGELLLPLPSCGTRGGRTSPSAVRFACGGSVEWGGVGSGRRVKRRKSGEPRVGWLHGRDKSADNIISAIALPSNLPDITATPACEPALKRAVKVPSPRSVT